MILSRFAKYTWGVLAYNVFVILFGAFVRATGSGAGCGAHWPLCNGVIVPRAQRIETVIELTHRLTSGITLILVIILLVWAWRKYPQGGLLRWSSVAVMFFTITEALVGAGLVLFGWVAQDTSAARAISVPVHLVNTFLLLGAIAVTAWWATNSAPAKLCLQGVSGLLVLVGGLAILLLGASGAVTALGDTLFPSSSLVEGFRQDFSPTAHFLIRMRIYHPGIAVGTGIYLFLTTLWVRRKLSEPRMEAITNWLFAMYVMQIILGIINVALLAPVWMQIIHLLASNLVWIAYVLMAVIVFSSAIPVGGFTQGAPGLSDHEFHDRVNKAEKVG
jgi:heme A synthase